MYFYEIYENIISYDFYFEIKDYKFIIISAYTSFYSNTISKDLTFDFINKNLEIIQFEIFPKVARVVFFKDKYYELFPHKEKKGYIKFDIPYIININIIYDDCQKHTKMQYKINGFKNNYLDIEPFSKDEYFTEIKKEKSFELIEKSNLEKRLKEIKDEEELLERERMGYD